MQPSLAIDGNAGGNYKSPSIYLEEMEEKSRCETALSAAKSGNLPQFKRYAMNGSSPYGSAQQHNTAGAITSGGASSKRMMDMEVLRNAVDDNGWTLLHYSAWYGHKQIVEMILRNHDESSNRATLKMLFFREDLHCASTPLHCAVQQGNSEIAAMLAAISPDQIMKPDKFKKTPLDYAPKSLKQHFMKLMNC